MSQLAPSYWGLSSDDWQRYHTLMQGIRGSISPSSLSPIEVLGIHARNGEERRRYAEQWAMMMREDAERILAFQHAYDEAQQRLFPQGQLIDAVKLAMHQSKTKTAPDKELGPTDRVLFFTATDCVACDAILGRLLARLPTIDGIDIYLLDVAPADEGRIREWAGSRKIEPIWVHGRRVTLNVDGGALDKLAVRLGDPLAQRPVVLRRRGRYGIANVQFLVLISGMKGGDKTALGDCCGLGSGFDEWNSCRRSAPCISGDCSGKRFARSLVLCRGFDREWSAQFEPTSIAPLALDIECKRARTVFCVTQSGVVGIARCPGQ